MSNGNFKVRYKRETDSCFTNNKIYEIQNGAFIDDEGDRRPIGLNKFYSDFKSLIDDYKGFEEVLTTSAEQISIFRRKNRVVATITKGEQKFTQSVALSKANGDFKAAVKMVVDRLMDKWNVEDVDTLTADGYRIVKQEKYEVGDKVKVIDNLYLDKRYDDGTVARQSMFDLRGKIVTIEKLSKISIGKYHVLEDKEGWFWTNGMFEGKVIETSVNSSFDWSAFKSGKFAVHCDTEEKAREFFMECNGQGIKWCSGKELKIQDTRWNMYKEQTSYWFDKDGICYSPDEFYRDEYHVDIIDYTLSKPTVKEVHRPAKVGEWIKVNGDGGHPNVKLGEIAKVTSLVEDEYGWVRVNGFKQYGGGCLKLDQYVVLENYQPEEPKPMLSIEEPKVETNPKAFVKAKVGDKIKVVKFADWHFSARNIVGNTYTVETVNDEWVCVGKYTFFNDDQEYIILDSAPENPSNKPLSAYTNRELSAELLRRYDKEGK